LRRTRRNASATTSVCSERVDSCSNSMFGSKYGLALGSVRISIFVSLTIFVHVSCVPVYYCHACAYLVHPLFQFAYRLQWSMCCLISRLSPFYHFAFSTHILVEVVHKCDLIYRHSTFLLYYCYWSTLERWSGHCTCCKPNK